MIVIAWILFIFNGLLSLDLSIKYMFQTVTMSELLLLMFSIGIVAVSAGVLWGSVL